MSYVEHDATPSQTLADSTPTTATGPSGGAGSSGGTGPSGSIVASPVARHTSQLPPRRRLWGSLRWRLSLWYVGSLMLILLTLGGILLFQGSRLIRDETYQAFVEDARATTTLTRADFRTAMSKKNADGSCPDFQTTFQSAIITRLAQESPGWQSVALLNPMTGVPLVASDSAILPAAGKLQQLRLDVAHSPDSLRNWASGVSHDAAVKYSFDDQGTPAAAYVAAYYYFTIPQCPPAATNLSAYIKTFPAVLVLVRDFSGTQATVQSFETLLAISVGLLFILGLAVGVPVTSASLKTLSRVSLAAQKLARGDLRQRVGVKEPHDEIEDLALTFDHMAEQVEIAFGEQQKSEQRVRQFLAEVSHELRTPITSIRGYLDVLARARGTPAENDYILRSARREAERMSRLVNDLLTLARFDTGRPLELAWADMWALVGEAVDQARLLAGGRTVTLHSDGEGRLMAYIDPDRIKQVLLVLLDNALKYGRQDAEGWVRVILGRTADAVVVRVSDNGPGIPPEALSHIFDRFYRVSQRAKANGVGAEGGAAMDTPIAHGSGLGLAIARVIVQAHDGTIEVANTVGAGATFTIRLPLSGPTRYAS
jgi:signal transduction histidine kinase